MKNFIQSGDQIIFTAGANLLSGAPVFIGGLVGIVAADVLSGAVGTASLKGVFSVTKVSAEAWAEGDRVYYDESLAKFTNVKDTDTKFAGYAVEVAANPTSTGKLLLVQPTAQAAIVAYSAGSNLVGVDGTGSNAAPLAGTETRLDAIDTAIAAMITALKNAGLMASA